MLGKYPESPVSRKAAAEIGLLYYQNDDYDRAIEAYKHVVTQYPGSEEARLATARLKVHLRRCQPRGRVCRPRRPDAGRNPRRTSFTEADRHDSISVECDIVIAAVGQGIESRYFVEQGIDAKWGIIQATGWTSIQNMPGIFAGGDCATGPATVIRAIAAGKVAAANIDQYLGYNHEITCDVKIPEPDLSDRTPCGRVNLTERPAGGRKCDFTLTECGMSLKEAGQEARRCLRCDHFGYGNFKGGRTTSW